MTLPDQATDYSQITLGRSLILWLGRPGSVTGDTSMFRSTRIFVSHKFTPNLMDSLGPSRV
jgi:hypothetical protein